MQVNRRTSRELVMKALYASELSHDSLEHIIETVLKPVLKKEKRLFEFAEHLFLKTIRDSKMIDAIISELASNWDIKRIALVDKMILRMALSEMLHFDDIPTTVTINEAIEIAKTYSTEKSAPFINGILDSASIKLSADGRISKTGLNLINSQSTDK